MIGDARYTSGSFIVKHGSEKDFVAAVEEVAEWTIENYSSVSEISLFGIRPAPGDLSPCFVGMMRKPLMPGGRIRSSVCI